MRLDDKKLTDSDTPLLALHNHNLSHDLELGKAMNAKSQAFDKDRADFISKQLCTLVNSIEIASDISGGKGSLTDFSDSEHKLLAEQFAQVTGTLTLCVEMVKDQDKPPLTIEIYEKFSMMFAELSVRTGLISGAFADRNELYDHLADMSTNVSEYLHQYKIDPVKLHKTAMDVVYGKFEEPEEQPKKGWMFWKQRSPVKT